MRKEVVHKLVQLLTDHDSEEKRLITLCRSRGCLPSELPSNEKEVHDRLEWLTLDQFYVATTEEGTEAINIYDKLRLPLLDADDQ